MRRKLLMIFSVGVVVFIFNCIGTIADANNNAIETRIVGFENVQTNIGKPLLLKAKLESKTGSLLDPWKELNDKKIIFSIKDDNNFTEKIDDGLENNEITNGFENDGEATCWYTPTNGDGNTFQVTAEFAGDSTYAAASITRNLDVSLAKWNYIIYMSADVRDLADDSIHLFNDLIKSSDNLNVNIYLLYDRSDGNNEHGGWTDTRRFIVTPELQNYWEKEPLVLNYLMFYGASGNHNSAEEENLGDSSTLQEFIEWCVDIMPSSQYSCLNTYGHGLGWTMNTNDNDNGDNPSGGDYLTARETREALQGAGATFDVITARSCMMSTIEVANELIAFAPNLVLSQTTQIPCVSIFNNSWDFNQIINGIEPATTPEELAEHICDKFDPILDNDPVSGTNIAWIQSDGFSELNDSVSLLGEQLRLDLDIENYSDIIRDQIDNAPRIPNDLDSPDWVDIKKFMDRIDYTPLAQTLAQNVVDALFLDNSENDVGVIKKVNKTLVIFAPGHGMSIYIPPEDGWDNTTVDRYLNYQESTEPPENLRFVQDTLWDEFLIALYDTNIPTCSVLLSHYGIWSGNIPISANCEDFKVGDPRAKIRASGIKYVEFMYSTKENPDINNDGDWMILPVGIQDGSNNDAKDWCAGNGWGFIFDTINPDLSVGFVETLNSEHVWFKARAVDWGGNKSDWSRTPEKIQVVNTIIPHCSNGIKDEDEGGIDCGGSCPNQNCCTNGYQDIDWGEEGIDCGGQCIVYVDEICGNGIDDNNDCQIDEGCISPNECTQNGQWGSGLEDGDEFYCASNRTYYACTQNDTGNYIYQHNNICRGECSGTDAECHNKAPNTSDCDANCQLIGGDCSPVGIYNFCDHNHASCDNGFSVDGNLYTRSPVGQNDEKHFFNGQSYYVDYAKVSFDCTGDCANIFIYYTDTIMDPEDFIDDYAECAWRECLGGQHFDCKNYDDIGHGRGYYRVKDYGLMKKRIYVLATYMNSDKCANAYVRYFDTDGDYIVDCFDDEDCQAGKICDRSSGNPLDWSCVEKPCIEDWSCAEWSECINGQQTRICVDNNNCGTENTKPSEEQECENTCNNGIKDGNEIGIDCGGHCPNQDCCSNGYQDANLGEEGIDCGGSCKRNCVDCYGKLCYWEPCSKNLTHLYTDNSIVDQKECLPDYGMWCDTDNDCSSQYLCKSDRDIVKIGANSFCCEPTECSGGNGGCFPSGTDVTEFGFGSAWCNNGKWVIYSCSNGIKDPNEEGIDCGGNCPNSCDCVVPIDDMIITKSTIFCSGEYTLATPISIGVSNITIDCNGAVLISSGESYWDAGFHFGYNYDDYNNVTIKNCELHNYNVGIDVWFSTDNSFINNKFVNNDRGIGLFCISNDNLIKDNQFYLAGGTGIAMNFECPRSIFNNKIFNNSFYGYSSWINGSGKNCSAVCDMTCGEDAEKGYTDNIFCYNDIGNYYYDFTFGPGCCVEKWECTEWSECFGGQQTRACVDNAACGTENAKPPVQQSCEDICNNEIKDGDEIGIDCGGSCPNQNCCTNGYQDVNLGEEGIDCGGSCPNECICVEELLFSDDFNDGNASDWNITNGNWSVIDGEFTAAGIAYAMAPVTPPNNHRITGKFNIGSMGSNKEADIIFRTKTQNGWRDGQYHQIQNRLDTGEVYPIRYDNVKGNLDWRNQIGTLHYPFEENTWYNFELIMNGMQADYYIEEQHMFSITMHDEEEQYWNMSGLKTYPNTASYFDDIEIYSYCGTEFNPTCSDGIKNGNETDVDCGGGICTQCEIKKNCNEHSDCESKFCDNGICGGPVLWIQLFSPCDIQVYDSQGRVTGVVNGEIKEEIPDSMYDEENHTVIIFAPSDSYFYKVVGNDEGTYGLVITSVVDGEETTFTATDIPTTPDEIHKYTIDWDALAQGEEGVAVEMDEDGDGNPEETFTTGDTLDMSANLETQIAIIQMIYGEEDILSAVTADTGDGTAPLLLSELKESSVDLESYTTDGMLNPGQKKKLKMKFKFLESAGNEYQGKSINVNFKFLAT